MADPYVPEKPGYAPYDPLGPELTNNITVLLTECFNLLKECYKVVEEKEGIVPDVLSFANLPDAIRSIPANIVIYRGTDEPPEKLGERGDLYFQDLN